MTDTSTANQSSEAEIIGLRSAIKTMADAIENCDTLRNTLAALSRGNLQQSMSAPIAIDVDQPPTTRKRSKQKLDPNSLHRRVRAVLELPGRESTGVPDQQIFDTLKEAAQLKSTETIKDVSHQLSRGQTTVFARLANGNWILKKHRKPITLKSVTS